MGSWSSLPRLGTRPREINMSSQLKTVRRAKEPPSRPSPDALRFIITRDASDKWIVMEMHGLYGGVFISRDAAVHFADLECRDREATFEVVTGRIERLERRNGKLHTQP
jgi:hypothetical protein